MAEAPATLEQAPAISPSTLLAAKIALLRRKLLSVAVATGVAMALAVSVELLALAMFVDWLMDLPWTVRLVLLLVQAVALSYIVFNMLVKPVVHQPDDDELALMVEKAKPEFRSRLIAAIQLARPGAIPAGASAMLADAMVEETEALAAPMDFNAIVPTDRLKKLGMLAVMVTVMGVLGFVFGGQPVRDLLKRAFLSNTPVPRKTRVIVMDGNKIVGRGDHVRLEAFVQGIIPSSGKIEIKYRSRRPQEFPLEQDKENKIRFGRTIENVQDSFTYTMYLNDGQSQTFDVKTIARPTVATIECDQEFPAYTKLKPVRRSLGDLSLLAGSKLKLKVTATKDIKTASIKLVGPETDIPMQLDDKNPRQLAGEFVVPARSEEHTSELQSL